MRPPHRIRTLVGDEPLLRRARRDAIRAGAGIWLVGGALRDRIAGRPCRDLDFLLRGNIRPFLGRFAARATGAVTFRRAGVTSHRLTFGERHCDLVELGQRRTVAEELRRRDFTLNTLVLDLRTGEFSDPLNGLRDLREKKIRAAGPDSIAADPLRILRGIRLACELKGFRIMPATRGRMRAARDRIGRVSAERIRNEFDRILGSGRAAAGLEELRGMGVLFRLLPELEPMVMTRQAGGIRVFDHTLEVVRHAGAWPRLGRSFRFRGTLADEDRAVLAYAALFHDIGKPDTFEADPGGSIHFYGHEKVSRTRVTGIARRWRFSTTRRLRIERLVLHHLRPGWLTAGDPTPAALRRVIRALGDDLPLLLLLSIADRRGSAPRGRREDDRHRAVCRELYRLYSSRGGSILQPPRLVTGRDVMDRLGIGPGPRVGEVLERIRELQEEGRVTTRAAALRELRRIGRRGG